MARRGKRQLTEARKSRWLWFEELEERTLLTITTAIWNPVVQVMGVYPWSQSGNWLAVGGGPTNAPANAGDIAIFQGSISNNPTLDQAETVGQIVFNTASNVTILPAAGAFTLTLDNTGGTGSTSITTTAANTGVDKIQVTLRLPTLLLPRICRAALWC